MSDPFVGEIRIMPYGGTGTYIPRGWAQCNGALLPIQQNTALYSLLGTYYGGNGTTNFALPDLRGRAIVGQGQGTGLTNYPQGTAAGTESVTLQTTQLPAHNHPIGTPTVPVNAAAGTATSPAGGYIASVGTTELYGAAGAGEMAANMLNGPTTQVGGNQAHENRQPFLTLGYFIATSGVYPTRQ